MVPTPTPSDPFQGLLEALDEIDRLLIEREKEIALIAARRRDLIEARALVEEAITGLRTSARP